MKITKTNAREGGCCCRGQSSVQCKDPPGDVLQYPVHALQEVVPGHCAACHNILRYCQALVPSPVPLDQIPNPKQSKIQSPIGTGDDTKITWATTPPTPNF